MRQLALNDDREQWSKFKEESDNNRKLQLAVLRVAAMGRNKYKFPFKLLEKMKKYPDLVEELAPSSVEKAASSVGNKPIMLFYGPVRSPPAHLCSRNLINALIF